jgi:hypothetical protein
VTHFFLSDVDQKDRVKTRIANFEFTEKVKIMKLIAHMFPYDSSHRVKTRIANFEFAEKVKILKLIAHMFPYDGDLAGAAAGKDKMR